MAKSWAGAGQGKEGMKRTVTVSANESWRRIAICNFMAAQLKTEEAQGAAATKRATAATEKCRKEQKQLCSGGAEVATEAAAIQNKPI